MPVSDIPFVNNLTALSRCADEHQYRITMRIIIDPNNHLYGKHNQLTANGKIFIDRLKSFGHEVVMKEGLSWARGTPEADLVMVLYCRCCGFPGSGPCTSSIKLQKKGARQGYRPPVLLVRAGKHPENANEEWLFVFGSVDLDSPDDELVKGIEAAASSKVGP